MKYKVGDKVKVREDLRLDRTYNKFTINRKMKNLAGTIVTIQRINENYYRIVEDDGMWGWTDEMFEDTEENKMDNNNITVNMENLSQEERSTLLSLIEKAKQKNKVWKPEENETYYYSYSYGNIDEDTWDSTNEDRNRYVLGNCFKTKEEAEFALEKQKVITKLKRFALEHNKEKIDWNNSKMKYFLYFNHEKNCIVITYSCIHQYICEPIYFTSEKIAQAAIEEIGEERLEKYYFEVKE